MALLRLIWVNEKYRHDRQRFYAIDPFSSGFFSNTKEKSPPKRASFHYSVI